MPPSRNARPWPKASVSSRAGWTGDASEPQDQHGGVTTGNGVGSVGASAPKIKLKLNAKPSDGGDAVRFMLGEREISHADEAGPSTSAATTAPALKLKLSLKPPPVAPAPEMPSIPKLKLKLAAPSASVNAEAGPSSRKRERSSTPQVAVSIKDDRSKADATADYGLPSGRVETASGSSKLRPPADIAKANHGPSALAPPPLQLPEDSTNFPSNPSNRYNTPPASIPIPSLAQTAEPKPSAKKPAKSRGKGWAPKRKVKSKLAEDGYEYDLPGSPGAELRTPGMGQDYQHGQAYPVAEYDRAAAAPGTMQGDHPDSPARKRVKTSAGPEEGDNDVVMGDAGPTGIGDDPYADAYEAPQAFVDSRFPSTIGRGGGDVEEEDRTPNIKGEDDDGEDPATPSASANAFDTTEGNTRDPSVLGTPFGGSEYDRVTPGVGGDDFGMENGFQFTPGSNVLGPEGRYKSGKRPWLKVKKGFKEVMRKVIADMKRKDGYGLFLDPVDSNEYPGYFEVIGGQENAMDLATMETKLDNGAYRSVNEFEADIEKMISAAETFNSEDSLVAREASKMRILAKKHVDRSRPLARTPSPEPVDMSGMASGTGAPGVDGDDFVREVSASVPPGGRTGRMATVEVPPKYTIPESMMDYPLNSDAARAIAFYQTGGQRTRGARERKGRERWDGQWREWYTEGDKNLREVDDVGELLREGFLETKLGIPDRVDFQAEEMQAQVGWLPAPFLTGTTVEEPPPPLPTRILNHNDFGIYGNLPEHLGSKATAAHTDEDVLGKIRTEISAAETNFAETEGYRPDAIDLLKEMTTGKNLAGEAYLRSIERFLGGAISGQDSSRPKETLDVQRMVAGHVKQEVTSPSTGSNGAEAVKPASKGTPRSHTALNTRQAEKDLDPAMADVTADLDLQTYVRREWRSGWLDTGPRRAAREAQGAYADLISNGGTPDRAALLEPKSISALDALFSGPIPSTPSITSVVQATFKRIPIELEVEAYAARRDGLDIGCLLRSPSDFSVVNPIGGPVSIGPARLEWFNRALHTVAEELLEASLVREQGLLANADKAKSDRKNLKQLRLDLLALAKNVPVHELKPMTPAEAEMLPVAVRGLIKVKPADMAV